MKEPVDFMMSDKNEKAITLLEQKRPESAKKVKGVNSKQIIY
jgi:hypothetical protein